MSKGHYSKLILILFIFVLTASVVFVGWKPKSGKLSEFEAVKLPQYINAENADLTIKGLVKAANPAYLNLETIMDMPQRTFTTYDPWDKKTQQYTGVEIYDLLKYLGLEKSATYIEIIAANDYRIPIKVEDLEKYDYILSYKVNGTLYSEVEAYKKKGSLAVAINFDGNKNMEIEVYKHQLVWQVIMIIVK